MAKAITLKNYRSFSEADFEFSEGVTIIIGPNASGKTNLLEAVHMLGQSSTFRGSDRDVIRHGQEWARVEGFLDDQKRVIKLQRDKPRTKKIIELNDTPTHRLRFGETVPIVLFQPDDARIIGGSPDRRRDYLDGLSSNTSPSYTSSLASYKRSLKQRNALLKTSTSSDSLFAWNVVLARHATELVTRRLEVIKQINEQISDIYSKLADTNCQVTVEYDCTVGIGNYHQRLVKQLEKNFEIDRVKGFTSIGPHRDDVLISLNGKDAGSYASRGEGRTLTLALKIIEQVLVEQSRGIKPLLLLDDVFSELDGTRRRMLTTNIRDHQAIITTTDADVVEKSFARLAQLITL